MEYSDNRSQLQREETIQKKRKKRSAKDDDDELPHSKKLGSEDGFVFSTRRVTRSASKQQHQQQHGEGEKQKKPFRWREMIDEELEAHKKKAEESEGFDVGEVPRDVFMNIILPCELDGPASELRPYNKMAKEALAAYNKENETKYKFVKHVRVNRMGGAVASSYYMTFQAKDKKAGSQNFQAAGDIYKEKKTPDANMKNSFYHAVTLIGFGVSDHDENEKYYEIQNSAGDDWGEDGYGYVSRDLFERYSYPINARIEGPGSPPSPPRRVWTRRARQLQPQPPQPQPPPPQLVIVYTRRPRPPQPQPPQPQPPQ